MTPWQRETDDWDLTPATDLDLKVGERLRSLSRERGLLDTTVGFCWWSFMRLYMRVYHRAKITGREHLPTKPPFVMVANHTSHLDAMTLASALRRRVRHCAYPIAAGDTFFESPIAATFAAFVLNALPMWRRNMGRYALQQLRDRLVNEPCCYILFPEGTRSRTGEMSHFRPGIGMLVAGTDVPVIPCHLTGAFEAMPPDKKFPRPRRLHLRVGTPLSFPSATNDREGRGKIAQEIEAAVRALPGSRRD